MHNSQNVLYFNNSEPFTKHPTEKTNTWHIIHFPVPYEQRDFFFFNLPAMLLFSSVPWTLYFCEQLQTYMIRLQALAVLQHL